MISKDILNHLILSNARFQSQQIAMGSLLSFYCIIFCQLKQMLEMFLTFLFKKIIFGVPHFAVCNLLIFLKNKIPDFNFQNILVDGGRKTSESFRLQRPPEEQVLHDERVERDAPAVEANDDDDVIRRINDVIEWIGLDVRDRVYSN